MGEHAKRSQYIRRKIDYSVFDDIGVGHKIYRSSSVDSNAAPSIDGSDTSMEAEAPLMEDRRDTLRRNSLSLGRSGTSLFKPGASKVRKFPSIPGKQVPLPKAPAGSLFPAIPESVPTISPPSTLGTQQKQPIVHQVLCTSKC